MENPKLTDCILEDDCDSYDAVVIGSGYGGSIAACRLSMAGLKVCLLEKGRKWEAQDFPTNSFQMVKAVRMEDRTLGVSFGPKDALYQVWCTGALLEVRFQGSGNCIYRKPQELGFPLPYKVYRQDDSLASMACGLGGGSLVNAGVMLPTPIRTRRDPRWPKDWERDWDVCQASVSTMLRIQDVPVKFKNAKILDAALGEGSGLTRQEPVKLTVNFDIEDQMYNSKKSQKIDSCQACGNCMSGCPYNAKNSTDKTYVVSAIQAGCVIRTECEVQWIVRNLDDSGEAGEARVSKKKRRWLVFLNEFDYVASDYVVLSAGVFGTTKILFQSQLRGLNLSETLGYGLSCNGNNVAYLARSPAPLNACGLYGKKLPDVPFEERPGPSISASYISSLGFTVQSAVVPFAFPKLLFSGITTYGWPFGYGILDSIINNVKHLFSQPSQDMVLNVMGYDNGDGKITFQEDTKGICFKPPTDPLLSRKIEALQRITKKLGGILFMSRYRSTSVHLLGGCCVSSDAASGVCNSNGQVFDSTSTTAVHPGLYVCDGSLIPCSVGINPCLTIATAAELVSQHLVQEALSYKSKGVDILKQKCVEKVDTFSSWKSQNNQESAVVFREIMRGHVGGLPCTAYLKVKLNLRVTSDKKIEEVGNSPCLQGKASGYIMCSAVEMDKLHVIDGEVDLCHVDTKTPYTQYMHYRLLLATSSGSRYILEGKKVMNPFFFALDAWKESTTLHVVFRKISKHTSGDVGINLKGKLHISVIELLKSVISLSGSEKTKFLYLLLKSLFRTYISQLPRESHQRFTPSDLYLSSYPSSTLHEIKTEDGFIIRCQQWKCDQRRQSYEEGKILLPVLLINGYATESYCLPTETNDLVRTLLQEGHETWILHSRLHPTTSASDNMIIEDIGMFDIPAAINKIIELHGESIKIHVVGHCIGGVAIHITLMGGHVSCSRIASLSCTNSSMYFKLTTWSKIKLWLPLVPMSMAILGKDKCLPLLQTLKATFRQKLLKSIARAMPRYERCTYDECEIFSGIFGNAFWHQNVSHKMHYWMNKEYLPKLAMGAFPHLRQICNAGFIVDKNGKNTYLVHPERMALPTLYISGGRTLLVTPQTSFLANKYMMLHQPRFRHKRLVIDGFGHSDLWIGEESPNKVFPHILSHIAFAEKENTSAFIATEREYKKDALSWAEDPFQDEGGDFWSYISPLINIYSFLCCLILFLAYFLY